LKSSFASPWPGRKKEEKDEEHANEYIKGVSHVIRLLRDELEIAMALCGCKTLAEADASILFK
jgi:isopentenyl diphosphate isomerase/L-lactate dehydrogenase-like FMN-dependent dehydrogenase